MWLKGFLERSTSDNFPALPMSTVTMGSSRRFRFKRHMCYQCFDWSFINSWAGGLCLDCQDDDAREARSTLFKHLSATCNIPDPWCVSLVPYLQPMHNAKAELRRQYLWNLLLGPPHEHRGETLLTRYQDGRVWNKLCNEDIIDRVLAFVCGVETIQDHHVRAQYEEWGVTISD